MAEILIKLERAADESNPCTWTRSHPVAVFKDGHEWGRLECPPKFLVLRIKDMTVEEAKAYLESDWNTEIVGEKIDITSMRAVRKWKFDIDDMAATAAVKDALSSAIRDGKVLEVESTQISTCIKRAL